MAVDCLWLLPKPSLSRSETQIRPQKTVGSFCGLWEEAGYPNAALKVGDRLVFHEKKKAEIAASFFTEVFSNNKETDIGLQQRADRVRDRLANYMSTLERVDLPVVLCCFDYR